MAKFATAAISSALSESSASGGNWRKRSAAARAPARLTCCTSKCIRITRPWAGTVSEDQPAASVLPLLVSSVSVSCASAPWPSPNTVALAGEEPVMNGSLSRLSSATAQVSPAAPDACKTASPDEVSTMLVVPVLLRNLVLSLTPTVTGAAPGLSRISR